MNKIVYYCGWALFGLNIILQNGEGRVEGLLLVMLSFMLGNKE